MSLAAAHRLAARGARVESETVRAETRLPAAAIVEPQHEARLDCGWLASSLLHFALRDWVRRRGDPRVAAFLPHRDGRRWEIRISKGADGDGNQIGKAAIFPIYRGATHRAEAIRQDVAALGRAGPFGGRSADSKLRSAKARLIADYGACATLAFQAMAHGDAHRFAGSKDVELAATAGGLAGDHGLSPQGSTMPRTVLKKFGCRNAGSRYPHASYEAESTFASIAWMQTKAWKWQTRRS